MAKVKDGFWKDKGILSDEYVLLAAGGHKALSDFSNDDHTHTLTIGNTEMTISASGTASNVYQSISGPLNIVTSSSENNAFSIQRNNATESVKHWIDNNKYHINYYNDDATSSIHWRIINPSTSFDLYFDSSGNFYPGTTNTGSLGINTNIWKTIYAQNIYSTVGIFANIGNSGTTGGIGLYGTDYTYGIIFRQTSSSSKLGKVQGDWATFFTMDDTTNRGWIFRSGTTSYASISTRGEAYFTAIGKNGYIPYPHGGKYTATTSSITGAICIELPVSWSSTMMKFEVDIYNYLTNNSVTYIIGGYNYNSGAGSWLATTAYSLRYKNIGRGNHTVRFGHNGTHCCIYIGETNSTWGYPQIIVRNFHAGFGRYDYNTWASGWDISFVTTLGTITSTITNPAVNYISDYTKLLYPQTTTITGATSTWSVVPSGSKKVWSESFVDSSFSYTPSSGATNQITDTGDIVMWLQPSATTNSATLNIAIDGGYYANGGFHHRSQDSNDYVLLAGGSYKAVADFAMANAYVKKAGDTMTGTLTFSVGAAGYSDSYSSKGINMGNSNITGVNSIYTADLSDNAQEGFHFYRDSTHVDTLYAASGVLYFVPNRQLTTYGTSRIIAHAGNITSKDATIDSSLTEIATIAGVSIKAKVNPQYITHMYVGDVDTSTNNEITNPYLKLFDDNTLRNQYQIKGEGTVNVNSDASGNLTIYSADKIPQAIISSETTATTTLGEVYGIVGSATSGARIPTRWFVNLDNGVTELTDGMIITFRIPVAGVATSGDCLTIDNNQDHFHQVVYNTNTYLTTHFDKNAIITVQYDASTSCNMYGKYDSSTGTYVHSGSNNSTRSVAGVWRVLSLYDSGNTNTDVRYQQTIYYDHRTVASDGAIRRYTLCMMNRFGEITSLSLTDNATTSTAKTMYAGYLEPRKVYYWAHTDNYAGGSAITRTNVLLTHNGDLIDYRYTFNCDKTLEPKKSFYIVGTIDNSGFKLDPTQPWSCTLPTTEDGKVYIYVGMIYDSYRGTLEENNTIYWFKDGVLKVYNGLDFSDFSGGIISSSDNTLSQSDHSITISGVTKTAGASTANIINSLSVSKLESSSTTNLTTAITINGVASADKTLTNIWARYLANLYTYSTRPTSINVSFGDGSLRVFKATSSTTTGKPTIGDAHIIHSAWDATNGYDTQIAIGTGGGMQYRRQSAGTWQSWITLIDSSNWTTNIDGRYVKKAGDTMSGPLDVTNESTTTVTKPGIKFGNVARIGASSGGIGVYTTGTIFLRPNQTINGSDFTYNAGIELTSTTLKYNNYLVAHAGNITDSSATLGTSLKTIATIAGVTISAKVDHVKTSPTAGTAGTSSPTSGLSFEIPYIQINGDGHITGYGKHQHSINAIPFDKLPAMWWANIRVSDSSSEATEPIFAKTRIKNDEYIGTAAGSQCHVSFNNTNKCLDFVFD